LEGLLDKAKDALDKARTTEATSKNNFEVLKQSLEDEIKYGEKDMANTKKALAETEGTKATAEGDLSVASKNLADDEKTLSTLHQDCLEKANDFEAETKSRGEELKALAAAKKIIAESSSGADSLAYGLDQVTFLQWSSGSGIHSKADLANFEAVRLVRDLARKTHDPALNQLAARMATAIRRAGNGADPFAKVKELIKNMIETLLGDAKADASHKAYCDKELGESAEKKAEKTATVDKLSSQIDSMSSKSAQLKEQVAALQRELATLAKSQSEMDKIRSEEKAQFQTNKAEMEEGIAGIKTALKVLRDYYAKDDKAHDAAEGAGSGIVGMLEVIESDFTKGLAEMTVTEQQAQSEYDKETRENEITKATKDQSVKYKTKEFKGLDTAVAEASADRRTAQEELDAILQYLGKLDDICIAKPETYSERKGRREAEIAGLKEALSILSGEAVLLQSRAKLRGVSKH
jgi:septal ring factor EnvC (AmiA/AmiB activator)